VIVARHPDANTTPCPVRESFWGSTVSTGRPTVDVDSTVTIESLMSLMTVTHEVTDDSDSPVNPDVHEDEGYAHGGRPALAPHNDLLNSTCAKLDLAHLR